MNPRVQQMFEAYRRAALTHFRRRHQARPEPLPATWMETYRVLARRAIREAKKYRDYIAQHRNADHE